VALTVSLREALSDRVWEQGVGTFFYDGVPFSFSTGAAFALSISQVIEALYGDKDAVCIEELGAGLGMLSVHLLRTLSRQFPAIFYKTKLHVTEFSHTLATELLDLGVFEQFLDRVTIGQEDCRKMSGHRPDIVLMTYVFDAIPVRQLVFQGGTWWERLVSHQLPERTVWDARCFPPRPIAATSLWSFGNDGVGSIETPPSACEDFPFALLRQVWSEVLETETLVPLSWDTVLDADREALQRIAAAQRDPTHVLRLNYPVGLSDILDGLWDGISQTGVLLIYDVGGLVDAETPNWANLQTLYGLTVCSMVPFSLIQEWASFRGVYCRYTNHPSGNSQVLLLSHAPVAEPVWTILEDVCSLYTYGAYAQVLGAIQSHPASFFEALSALAIRENVAMALQISAGMASDYTVMMQAAERCYSYGLYAQSQAFLDVALADYGAVGASAWLLRGKVLKAMADFDGAFDAFSRGYRITPQSEYLLYELGALALLQKDYAAYIGYAKDYLRYRCHLPDVLETVVTVLVCMSLLGQRDAVLTACSDLLSTSYGDSIPEPIRKKVLAVQGAV